MITRLFPFNLFTVKFFRYFSIWNPRYLDRHTKYTPPGYSYQILIMFICLSYSSRSDIGWVTLGCRHVTPGD